MKTQAIHWFKYAAPENFYPLAGRMWPWFGGLAALLTLIGLWIGFFVAPIDAQQGQGYRIIFIHVPVSQMSMFIYLVMAFWAAIGLAFNTRLSGMMASALAPTGALFAFLSLVTGSLWGKPMWGAWWVWDARLTSELILLFLYLGFLALQSSIDDPRRADKACAVLAFSCAFTTSLCGSCCGARSSVRACRRCPSAASAPPCQTWRKMVSHP